MEKTTKSLTISKLIKELQALKQQMGDKEVVLSSDPEGNSFGTLDPQFSYGQDDGLLILYPVEQFTL